MRIRLLGKYYDLVRIYLRKNYGLCDPPENANKTIKVCTTARGKTELRILLHEFFHACDWHKDEAWIDSASHDIAHVLWRLGYRKTDVKPPERP